MIISATNESIDFYDKIVELVKEEITRVTYLNEDFYSGYTFKIANEQFFDVERDQEMILSNEDGNQTTSLQKTIYIVLKFSSTSISFGQNIIPASIEVLSESGSNEVAQKLMSDFTSLYNTSMDSSYKIKQIYQAPVNTSNFNEAFNGFRSVLSIECLYLYSEDAKYSEIYYVTTEDDVETEHKIDFIKFGASFSNTLDTKAFYTSNNGAVSIALISAYTISLVVYLRDDDFCNKIISVADGDDDNNSTFVFHIKRMPGGTTSSRQNFILNGMQEEKPIDDFQIVSLSFTIADMGDN